MTLAESVGPAGQPSASICLPVWNSADLVPIAIEGALAQTEGGWQLIVGDNASSDDLQSVVAQYNDPRIIYQRWDAHVGPEENFNRTMALATGDWIIPIGADDRLHPGALETILGAGRGGAPGDASNAPSPAMVLTACRRVLPDGSSAEAEYYGSQRPVVVKSGRYDGAAWLRVGASGGPFPWNIGSAAFATAALRDAGGFRPSLGLSADTELIFRIAAVGDVVYIDRPLLDFMVRIDSDGNQRWAQTLRRRSRTPLALALTSALAAHEQRRPVAPTERRAILRAAATSHLRRAAQHRILAFGRGRRGALGDVLTGIRLYPGLLFGVEGLLLAGGSLLAPGWVLRRVSASMRHRAYRASARGGRRPDSGASATVPSNRP